ncbi:hypothetical protein V492_04464, partial [Pseudogymnoascus sp. VKM F-4246]
MDLHGLLQSHPHHHHAHQQAQQQSYDHRLAPSQPYTSLPISYGSPSYLDMQALPQQQQQQQTQQSQQGIYDFPFSQHQHQQQQQQQQQQPSYFPPRRHAYEMPTSAPQHSVFTSRVPRSYAGVPTAQSFGGAAAIAPATGNGWGKAQEGEFQQAPVAQEVTQSTDVDALMRAIQAKPSASSSPGGDAGEAAAAGEKRVRAGDSSGVETERGSAGAEDPKKRHAHTPTAPTPSPNSATSKRTSVGTPRGNVRAHAAVHDAGGAAKKFVCRLDGCGKCFTQLGNLKSHMNKFHKETLRGLTVRVGESEARSEGNGEGGQVGEEEDELLEYFRSLYRNANKGIKGRGKGRKVAATHHNNNAHGHGHGHAGNISTPPSLSSSTSSLSSLASLSSASSSSSYPTHHMNLGFGAGGLGMNGMGVGGVSAMEMELFDGSSSGIG